MTLARVIPDPDDVRVIVGDTHGDYLNMLRVLQQVGAVDADGRRAPGYWTCHVGDVIHGGHGVQLADVACLELALEMFDCLLYGNHETPFATGIGGFAGQNRALECQELLSESVRDGRWRAATAVDGHLVCHAGLHPSLAASSPAFEQLRREGALGDVAAVARAIDNAFVQRVADGEAQPLFDWVGWRRGGPEPFGGIFWCDWRDLLDAQREPPVAMPQIVGHTPGSDVEVAFAGRLQNVDVGAALSGYVAAIVKPAAESDWTPLRAGTGVAIRGRLEAIQETRGALTSDYEPGYLKRLREDWPQ